MDERLTSGTDMWHLSASDGLDSIKVTDGPAGARGERWFASSSACVPCGTALGATWDPATAAAVAGVLARETRRKGADVLLAPTVNLHRHPLAGRNFECMSEDPELTARLASAWIVALQGAGVGACVKHFVANDQETDRHAISAEVDEAVLRELYLRPFEAAVREAGTWSIMSAYNRLGGEYCSQNHWLLTRVLRDEWGFDGVVVSDWWGTHATAALAAGLDVEMPGPPRHLGPLVRSGLEDGTVPPEALRRADTAVRTLGQRVGAAPGRAVAAEESVEDPADRAVLRRAAVESIVLLRDEGGVLPLPRDRPVAVAGPNAARTAIMGGGSAAFVPHRRSDILAALRSRLAEVTHTRGVPASASLPPLECAGGFTVEHFTTPEPLGEPLLVEHSLTSRLFWLGPPAPGVPEHGGCVRITGDLLPQTGGEHTFGLVTGATGRLSVGGEGVLDNRTDRRPGTSFFGLGSAEERARVELAAGRPVPIEAVTVPVEGMALGGMALGHSEPVGDDPLGAAVSAAQAADFAVVVVGGDEQWETEGSDRAGFELPDGQPELVRAVCAANPRTVVVVNCGAPVDLSCADRAAAILLCWYPGQEGGEAVADVLVGDADPGGRLPTTWGHRLPDWASDSFFPGDGTQVTYGEGFGLGYRGFDRDGVEPAFCFGHGLSLARFEWSGPSIERSEVPVTELAEGLVVCASVTVENVSDRPGTDVVQFYLAPTAGEAAGLLRAPRELVGFAKVRLEPGERTEVSAALGETAFRRWQEGWSVPTGQWELLVSASSRDHRFSLPLRTTS